VYHDFHWLLAATKLFTAKLHSSLLRSRKFWKGRGRTFYLRLRNPDQSKSVSDNNLMCIWLLQLQGLKIKPHKNYRVWFALSTDAFVWRKKLTLMLVRCISSFVIAWSKRYLACLLLHRNFANASKKIGVPLLLSMIRSISLIYLHGSRINQVAITYGKCVCSFRAGVPKLFCFCTPKNV